MPTPARLQRYVVESIPRAELAERWDAYLEHHLAEVVLTRHFTGAEIVREGDVRACGYAVPDPQALESYLAEDAPALRQDSERHFPEGIERRRRVDPVALRVSAAFEWDALGLRDAKGHPVPCPSDGAFRLAYFAPWCEDCTTAWRDLLASIGETNGRGALVRVYTPEAGPLENATDLPVWNEPGEKDEATRLRGFQGVLRALSADERRWGLPVTYDLWVAGGRFVVCWR